MKRLALFALALAGIVVGVVGIPAATQALPPGVVPGPNSITGVVTDIIGNPLSDIVVTDSSGVASTTTDLDGTYLLEGLVAGDVYTVTATDPFGRFPSATTDPLVVSADGPMTAAIVMLLFPTTSVSGTVRDVNGAPLEGILVTESQHGSSTSTAADGTYTLLGINVDGNTLSITASDPSGLHVATTSDQFLAPSDGTTVVDLTMPDDVPVVVGTVTDPDGAPVGGAAVALLEFALSTTTAPDGRFAFGGSLPDGTFTLSVDPSNSRPDLQPTDVPVMLVTGTIVDASVQLNRAATFEVRVTAAGRPASGNVSVYAATDFGPVVSSGALAADGTVSLPVRADGQYVLRIDSTSDGFASEFFPDQVRRATATRLTITGEQHVPVAVVLEKAATISGTITMPDGTPGDSTQIQPQIAGPTDQFSELPACNLARNTDPAGSYRVGCLHPSTDWIIKGLGNGQADDSYYRNSQSAFNATRFAVNPGQAVTGVNLKLTPRSPSPTFIGMSQTYFVSGTTTKGVHVYGTNFPRDFHALRIDTSSEGVGPDTFITVTSVLSSTEAVATVKVNPGAIGPLPIIRDCFMLDSIGGFVERFNCFTSGDATTPVGTISGAVTDNRGKAVRGAGVRFTSLDGTIVRHVVTGSDGTYAGTGLAPGQYTVLFEGTDALNGQFWKGAVTATTSRPVTVTAGKAQRNVSAQLTRRAPVTVTAASPDTVDFFAPTFDLLGTGLSAITGGFRVTIPDSGSTPIPFNIEPISDTRLHATGFFASGGVHDLNIEWTTSTGLIKKAVCVKCLTVYGNFFYFSATGVLTAGTTSTVHLDGDGFFNLSSVTVDGVGITVDGYATNGPGSLDITLTAAIDAAPNPDTGSVMLNIVRADGRSILLFLPLLPAEVPV